MSLACLTILHHHLPQHTARCLAWGVSRVLPCHLNTPAPTTRGLSITSHTATKMTAFQVCANLTTMFPECGPLAGRYGAARRAGFGFVEVSLPYSETPENLARELQEHQLKQVLINSDPGRIEAGEMGCACIPGKEATFRDSLNRTLTYAKALKCNMIHVMVGKRDKSHTDEEHLHTLEKNLQYATDLFDEEGIVGVIEPKNNITFPGYFLNNYDLAVNLLSKIDSPNMRLLLDIFHMQLICGNITHNIDRLLPYTAHIQVSQPPNRSEPGAPGELDFEYVIDKLKSAGYRGYIGAEYIPTTKKTEESLDWIKKCGLTL